MLEEGSTPYIMGTHNIGYGDQIRILKHEISPVSITLDLGNFILTLFHKSAADNFEYVWAKKWKISVKESNNDH